MSWNSPKRETELRVESLQMLSELSRGARKVTVPLPPDETSRTQRLGPNEMKKKKPVLHLDQFPQVGVWQCLTPGIRYKSSALNQKWPTSFFLFRNES